MAYSSVLLPIRAVTILASRAAGLIGHNLLGSPPALGPKVFLGLRIVIVLSSQFVGLAEVFGNLIAKDRGVEPIKITLGVAGQGYKGIERSQLGTLLIAEFVAVSALYQDDFSVERGIHNFVFLNTSAFHVLLAGLSAFLRMRRQRCKRVHCHWRFLYDS